MKFGTMMQIGPLQGTDGCKIQMVAAVILKNHKNRDITATV